MSDERNKKCEKLQVLLGERFRAEDLDEINKIYE